MEHFPYLLAAYSIIFVLIALYVIFLQSRQARLRNRIRAAEARLARLDETVARRPRDAASS
ncbi:MAG TPA: CcmD family protein [Candidatus Binataceae bacterium]|nr:CcmD family protein [Candidatus Binataceae bacterium]